MEYDEFNAIGARFGYDSLEVYAQLESFDAKLNALFLSLDRQNGLVRQGLNGFID